MARLPAGLVDGRSAWLACGFGSWRWWGKDDDAPGGIPAVWWDAIGALPSSCIPSTTLGASMLLLQQISACEHCSSCWFFACDFGRTQG